VTHLHRRTPNIGRCVGLLYFFNTIGSALACFLTVDLLFVFAGRQAAVGVAALLNFLVAVGVVLYARQARRAAPAAEPSVGLEAAEAADAVASAHRASFSIPYSLVLLISALAGYLSLSQEMLWVRTVSYSAQGMPQVFGQVLGFFLVGIALGSLSGKKFCERADQGKAGHPLAFIARLFLFGSLAYFLCIPLFAEVALFDKTLSLVLSYLTVGLVAFVYGTILPVISHFGIAPGKPVGTSLSRIYMANIVGSTLGPILTGFYLMDRFTLEANVLGVSLGSLAFAAALFAIAPLRARARWGFAGLVAACALGAVALQGPLYGSLLGKLQHGPKFAEHAPFDQIVQNRSGIITTQPDSLGDLIYGGGAYDGRFTVDAARNSNGIRRGYMMAALHRDPADVLEIGLSSGSWAWVIAAYEPVKSLTVVEINPGYPAVIGKYGEGHADFLYDSTVTIHYDDGRRWLNRNPDARFDFILMNTTFHWRSNITNLVSREFLELAKRHLKPGGVMYYNATGSPDVVRTAAEVFRHVTMVASFVAASDGPFDMSEAEKRARFDLFLAGPDRRPVFADSAQRAAAAEMAATPLPDLAPAYRARANLRVITDDNMLTEFKSISRKGIMGRLYRWRDPNLAWARIAARRDSADVAAAAR
jgi:spermidine synthase